MSVNIVTAETNPDIIVEGILSELNIHGHSTAQVAQITDTGDRNAFLKIHGSYTRHLGRADLHDRQVIVKAAYNTIETGFAASELINNQQRPDRVNIAVNYAAPDKKEGTKDNARKDFFGAVLLGEDTITGTSNGYEFSYLKRDIQGFYRLVTTNAKGTQFRSLEVLPEFNVLFSVPRIRERLIRTGILQRVEHIDDIVPSPVNATHVVETDNFKNVKLYITLSDRKLLEDREGKTIEFSFGKTSVEHAPFAQIKYRWGRIAQVTPTLFHAPIGTNLIALRSSSTLSGRVDVPILATIRDRPGETDPRYHVPTVGVPLRIVARDKNRTDNLRELTLDGMQFLQKLPQRLFAPGMRYA